MLSTLDVPAAVLEARQAAPARKVAVLTADAATQAGLRAWAEFHGFDLAASFGGEVADPAKFEFHLTLFATVEASDLPEFDGEIEPISVHAIGFDELGADRTTPALIIEASPELSALREAWLEEAEATPTYADFRPHVSLSYAWNGVPDLATLEPPVMTIVLDRISVRTLNDAPKSAPKGVFSDITDALGLTNVAETEAAAAAAERAALLAKVGELRDRLWAIAADGGEDARAAARCLYTMPTEDDQASTWYAWCIHGVPSNMRVGGVSDLAAEIGQAYWDMANKSEKSARRQKSAAKLTLPGEVRSRLAGDSAAGQLVAEHDRLVAEIEDREAALDEIEDLIEEASLAMVSALADFRVINGREPMPAEIAALAADVEALIARRAGYLSDVAAISASLDPIENDLFLMVDSLPKSQRASQRKADGNYYALAFSLIEQEIRQPDTTADRLDELLAAAKDLESAMATDPDVTLESAIEAAQTIGVIRLTTSSVANVADSIVRYIVWVIYNIEADRMAARATPW